MKRINIDIKKVLKLYENGIGTCEIAKRLSVGRDKIWRTLKENSIQPERITRPYKNFFDITFFKNYNELSCYWAGFIMADGNIHTKRQALQIGLASKDKKHLIKFSNHIKHNNKLTYNKKTNSYKIFISGKWFANDLKNNFGITSDKTFTTVFPKLQDEYNLDFIRGIFDGDGCITQTNQNGYIRDLIIFCGTFELMQFIENYFYNLGVITHNNTGHASISKNRSIYTISFSNKNAFKILNFIYKDCNIYLDRKYKKYKKLCKKYIL